MATVRSDADDIQRQMAEIRSQLRQEVRGVAKDVAIATDWRAYVRSRPWLAIGAAFGAGFFLVPRRSHASTIVVRPQPAATLKAVESEAVGGSGFKPFRWAFGLIGPIVLRAAQSYALNYVEGLLTNQQMPPRVSPGSRPTNPGTPPRGDGRRFASRD